MEHELPRKEGHPCAASREGDSCMLGETGRRRCKAGSETETGCLFASAQGSVGEGAHLAIDREDAVHAQGQLRVQRQGHIAAKQRAETSLPAEPVKLSERWRPGDDQVFARERERDCERQSAKGAKGQGSRGKSGTKNSLSAGERERGCALCEARIERRGDRRESEQLIPSKVKERGELPSHHPNPRKMRG